MPQVAAAAAEPAQSLADARANFAPAGPAHPIPADVTVTEVVADGLPAHWLDLPGVDPGTPLASPLFGSLEGLPPLLVQVGTSDLLLSDAGRLAEAGAGAGVDVRLEVGDGLPHVYQLMLGTPEAADATGRIGAFLRERVS